MIVDLDELNVRELLEVEHKQARNVIQRAVRLADAIEIHVRDAIGKLKFLISCESVEDQCQSLISFNVARAFEEFIENAANQVLRGWNETRHWNLVRQLAINEPLVIREVDVDLHVQRCARWRGCTRKGRCETRCKGRRDRRRA